LQCREKTPLTADVSGAQDRDEQYPQGGLNNPQIPKEKLTFRARAAQIPAHATPTYHF